MVMNNYILTGMSFSPARVNQRFEGTYCFRLQGRRTIKVGNQEKEGIKQSFRALNMELYIPA
jgi:hypothetical protein